MKKLDWLNHEYIKEYDDKKLAELVKPRIEKLGGDLSLVKDLPGVMALLKSREPTSRLLPKQQCCSAITIRLMLLLCPLSSRTRKMLLSKRWLLSSAKHLPSNGRKKTSMDLMKEING